MQLVSCVDDLSLLFELLSLEDIRRPLDQADRQIPQDWTRNWDALRATLQSLEERGMTPRAALASLLRAEIHRDRYSAFDTSPVAHFEDWLGTNYVPTPRERDKIQQFRGTALRRVSDLSAEIEAYAQRLSAATEGLKAVRDLVDPYLALVSPVRAVPPEILQEIFIACLPDAHNAIMDTSQAPLLLGRVCASWRTISVATSALWASVHVVLPRVRYMAGARDEVWSAREALGRCEGLATWLARSGDCPLSISLCSRCGTAEPAFLTTIHPYARRFKALRLPFHVASRLSGLDPADLALLEAADFRDIDFAGALPFPPRPECSWLLAVTPNLRSISLASARAWLLPERPWARITRLELRSYSWFFTPDMAGAILILAQCTALEICTLRFPIKPDPAPRETATPGHHAILRKLHTLSLWGPA
ncbi:hypothetical protein B0H15DRAFT_885899, partial [Mycena belliarum]